MCLCVTFPILVCVAADDATALEWLTTDFMAEDVLTPRQMSEHYSPPIIPTYPRQNRRLPLAMAGVVQASALQMLTPQQALEAAARGKAVARAECVLARVTLPIPPAIAARSAPEA